jgi:hypothetical protein
VWLLAHFWLAFAAPVLTSRLNIRAFGFRCQKSFFYR